MTIIGVYNNDFEIFRFEFFYFFLGYYYWINFCVIVLEIYIKIYINYLFIYKYMLLIN